ISTLGRNAVALVLDGRALAKQIEADLFTRVEALKAKSGRTPILATILVGDDGASATYVRMKGNACRRVGMDSLKVELPTETTTEQLLAEIEKLNANPDVHGILLQHPVPAQIDERACFDAISLEKDVDGVTCLGYGRMAMGEAAYGSATPAGIMTTLKENNIEIRSEQLLAEIEKLNANPDVHGILLQHPVPAQIDERACFDAISLEKDVDGVTCLGYGRMAMGEAAYGSATPAGIMTILKENNIEI